MKIMAKLRLFSAGATVLIMPQFKDIENFVYMIVYKEQSCNE